MDTPNKAEQEIAEILAASQPPVAEVVSTWGGDGQHVKVYVDEELAAVVYGPLLDGGWNAYLAQDRPGWSTRNYLTKERALREVYAALALTLPA